MVTGFFWSVDSVRLSSSDVHVKWGSFLLVSERPAVQVRCPGRVRSRLRSILVACLLLFLTTTAKATADEPANHAPDAFKLPAVEHYRLHMHSYTVVVVRVNLNDPGISVMSVVAPRVKATLHQFINYYHPIAAINGTFFDTRTWRITGNIVQDGRLVHEGYVGNTIAFTPDNRPSLLCTTHRMGRHTDWHRFGTAMGAGPTLIMAGHLQCDPRGEGFHDPGLFRFARRSAVGFTRSGTLLLVSVQTPVTFHQLASIMAALGVYTAVSLDGGSSSALYCSGDILSEPRRPLTNLLVIYRHKVASPPTLNQSGPAAQRMMNLVAAAIMATLAGLDGVLFRLGPPQPSPARRLPPPSPARRGPIANLAPVRRTSTRRRGRGHVT